jgi:3-hydroxy-9,10-secoandrosta-1,3,5(10)-triene-9,17-dione monooxygenase reductase component
MQATLAVDKDSFRKICSRFATGIAIATVAGENGAPLGLTINSFTSVSCCPPLVLICIDYRCALLPAFRAHSYYGINFLADSQRDLSVRFAQREINRFEGVLWRHGETGVPLIDGCLGQLECCVSQAVEAGDHAILIAEVVAAECRDGEPLVYYGSSYRSLQPSRPSL